MAVELDLQRGRLQVRCELREGERTDEKTEEHGHNLSRGSEALEDEGRAVVEGERAGG